ncbi:MAG: leucine-rich repeat domain-containing protein [Lachnospiraceae bacterium]|nr:leucine-rich repeat domain-containing protein [Lachnospiraceae bacterium]
MKKNHLFKMLAVTLALALVIGALPVAVSKARAATKTSGDWEYEVDGNKATITKYNGDKDTVTVPSKLGGKAVVKIGRYAFEKNKSIETVKIPKGITEIGRSAFSDCINLTKVVFAKKIKLKKIEDSAFSSCYSLTTIKIPSTVTEIGSSVFSYCKSLKSMTFPAKATTLGDSMFYNCENLESVTVKGKITKLPDSFFWGCKYLDKYSIPDTIKELGDACFGGCDQLIEITVPASCEKVGTHAFSFCESLEKIDFGKNTVELGYELFLSSPNIETLIIPSATKTFNEGIFGRSSDEMRKYLVVITPSGSKAEKWAENNELTVKNK